MSSGSIQVRQATIEDAQIVTDLAQHLLVELGGFQTGDPTSLVTFCSQLLASAHYTAFLSFDDHNTPLGLLTLHESSALYVAGSLGWIQEQYVTPPARSLGVGQQLLEAALAYGQARGWKRLEVNTPDAESWPRTVAFYRHNGFQGGSYHLRMPLT